MYQTISRESPFHGFVVPGCTTLEFFVIKVKQIEPCLPATLSAPD
jgi:hypothetical protein